MIQTRKSLSALVFLLIAGIVMSGCAGTYASKYTYNNSYNDNAPVKGEKCYDAAVVLGVDMKRAKEIAKKVVVALDSEINEETNDTIKATRVSHIGVFVGSGGEELTVNVKEIDKNRTFVTTTTKTGFVGAAGMKPWSCKIVDEMVKMATK